MAPGSEAGIPAAKDAGIPSAKPVGSTGAPAADVAVAPIASDHRVTITSDVLTLSLDGGNVFDAQLLQYPQTREPDSPPVKLLDDDPAHYYIARSGWIGQGGTRVPELVPEDPQQREIDLTTGQPTVQVSRSEEHTSELQSLMRISYAVFCLKKKKNYIHIRQNNIE